MSEPGQETQGTVARVDFGSCVLLMDDDTLITAVARGKLMGRKKALGNAVVVGDRVQVVIGDSKDHHSTIEGVEERRNSFSRRASGRQALEQVVAASLDQVLMVSACADPEFSPGLTDRVFCQAEHAEVPARLVLNKIDLAARESGGRARALEILQDYERAGYPGHLVSAHSGEGIDDLRRTMAGRRTLLVGHSGVGKSTLLNALVPGLENLVGLVNAKTGKGRHTTTAFTLVRPEPGLELIDSPGVRAFGLWGIGPRDLDHAYREFRPHLGCRFGDCSHTREPGCALQAAVQSGEVSQRRYASFLKLRDELEAETGKDDLRTTGWM